MKKILLIAIVAFLSSCDTKQVTSNENIDVKAQYKTIGRIDADFGLQIFKVKVDSIDYIVVSRFDGGTAIIKHGK